MIEESQFELRKFVAPEFVFGFDARMLAGRYAKNFGGRRVLVVTDPGVKGAGWTEEVLDSLHEAQLDCVVFDAVTSNPKAAEVMSGAEVYRQEKCNIIVAVGGGSPMDCAKGIGIICSNKGHILDFEGVDNVPLPLPPLICIPTTAGSSADVSQFAIITDPLRRVKMAIISKMIVPDVALIDPITTTTMSAELTACTAMDALCHGFEAYVSTAHSPITDLHALQAIDLVNSTLLPVLHDPQNITLRGRMMLASLDAGLAFSNASLGATHAMAHSLGGLLDSPHGECNALLLSHVVAFNFRSAADRYRRIATAMGMETAGMSTPKVAGSLCARLAFLCAEAGLTHTLGQLGVKREHIPVLAEYALQDPCMVTNPREPTLRDVEAIYEQAL